MPRPNGAIALGRNSDEDNTAGGGLGALFSKKIGFFGMVGATMAALKLKEHWDEYRRVPTESTATNNPLAPPAYRDDDCDTESAIGLDTSINMPTRTRRKKNCCMCCGMNCGLFCKALGIVVLLFMLWNAFKLAKWALTPSPTGLENMPEFSTSLGCLDAPHFFQDSTNGALYSIPIGDNVDHDVVISGSAVGTLILAPSTSVNEDAIKIRASVRTDDASLLEHVEVHTPGSTPSPPQGVKSSSYFGLATPDNAENAISCLRYDVTVYLPPTLRTLRVRTSSLTHLKLDFDHAPRELHALKLDLTHRADGNLLQASEDLIADNIDVSMRGGYLVGALALANSTRVDTRQGDAIVKVSVITSGYAIPDPSENDDARGAVAHLTTLTGTGRADFEYENRAGRPVRSEHISRGQGDSELRLTYKQARFNGRVELEAQSYSMRNVQTERGTRPGDKAERWFGDKEGGDLLKVNASGWVGLYF